MNMRTARLAALIALPGLLALTACEADGPDAPAELPQPPDDMPPPDMPPPDMPPPDMPPPDEATPYPWGDRFDAAEAAAACADAPGAWWCGGRASAEADDAALDDVWLGFRLTDAPCPAAGAWRVDTPFTGIGHPDLDRVCRYTWTRLGAGPDVESLPDDGTVRLERDRRVVAAHAVPRGVWSPLEAAWTTQLDLPDWSAAPDAAPAPVRVAIVDNSPEELRPGGALAGVPTPHGWAVGTVVRAIACPAERGEPGPCAAALTHHLALPRLFAGGTDRGGEYGSQGEFAAAVVSAVAAWQADGATERLVINMSVGWTAPHGGAVGEAGRFVPQLGRWALDTASCAGALAIAAAGNRWTVDGVGAIYPAAWAAVPSSCDPSVPPVYAVGGVDGADRPLGIARPGSHPRLVAPAAHVLLRDPRFAADGAQC